MFSKILRFLIFALIISTLSYAQDRSELQEDHVAPIRTAVFPVAGLGTRLLPATISVPKEMMIVGEKPLIQLAVEEAKASGIEKFIFVTAQGKGAIEDHFDYNQKLEDLLLKQGKNQAVEEVRSVRLKPGENIFIRQQEPLGLGHAVWCARDLVGDNPFAVILPDDYILNKGAPCLKQMMDARNRLGGGNFVAVMDVEMDQVSRYGILDIEVDQDPLVKVRRFVEKPAPTLSPSRTAIIGRYILEPKIFDILEHQKPGVGGEIQLTDAFNPLMKEFDFYGLRFMGQRFDCGLKEGLLEANIAYAASQPKMLSHLESVVKKYLPSLASREF